MNKRISSLLGVMEETNEPDSIKQIGRDIQGLSIDLQKIVKKLQIEWNRLQ